MWLCYFAISQQIHAIASDDNIGISCPSAQVDRIRVVIGVLSERSPIKFEMDFLFGLFRKSHKTQGTEHPRPGRMVLKTNLACVNNGGR